MPEEQHKCYAIVSLKIKISILQRSSNWSLQILSKLNFN